MKITERYRMELEILHAQFYWDSNVARFAPLINQIVDKLGVTELLDYGCGQGELLPHLHFSHPVKVQMYDPAVSRYAGDPLPMQLCVCVNVLEHVENECLDDVLSDIVRCAGTVAFVAVMETDERPGEWWITRLASRFDLQTFQRVGDGQFYAILFAKPEGIIVHENVAIEHSKLIVEH